MASGGWPITHCHRNQVPVGDSAMSGHATVMLLSSLIVKVLDTLLAVVKENEADNVTDPKLNPDSILALKDADCSVLVSVPSIVSMDSVKVVPISGADPRVFH